MPKEVKASDEPAKPEVQPLSPFEAFVCAGMLTSTDPTRTGVLNKGQVIEIVRNSPRNDRKMTDGAIRRAIDKLALRQDGCLKEVAPGQYQLRK